MIRDTVRQRFRVLVSIFYRRIRTFFRVITYFIELLPILFIIILSYNNYVYYKYNIKSGGQTKEEGQIC